MRALVTVAAIAACALSIAQGGFAYGTAPQNGPFGPVVNWSTYERGTNCEIVQPGVYTLTSHHDYLQYQRMFHGPHYGSRFVNPACPVDFNRYMLVAIHMGRQTSGGYNIWVDRIQRTSSHYYGVYVMNQVPLRGSAATMALTSPYVIIQIERTVGIPQYYYTNYGAPVQTFHQHGCGCCNSGAVYRWQGGTLVRVG